VFITDGKPTIGERDSDAILKNVAGRNAQAASRVFVFGVGEDLNTHLLDKLAEQHRGTRTYVAEQESIEAKVSSFYDKVKSPVLTDLQLDFGDLQVKHVYPRQLGDLFAGGQLLVFGRYRAGEAASDHAITLTGNVSGKPQRFTYEASFPADETGNAFLPRLWAQRKVGHLLDELRLHGDNPELKQEVIELGKRFGIVTPYTSALVLEDAARPMLAMRRGGAGGGEQQDGQGAAPEPANAPADSGKLLEHERLKAESGRNAVEQSESIRKMQDSDSLDEANDHYETLEGKATQRLIRRIEDRTFIRGQDGTYVESELLAKPEAVAAAVKIEYLSQAYFDLAASSPLIARYLKVGSRVIFSFESKVYSIAPAATEPEQAPEQKTPEQPRD
jgi:Ca-activated chloride channel family protein